MQLWKLACVNLTHEHTYVIKNIPKCYELIKSEQEFPPKLSHGLSNGD